MAREGHPAGPNLFGRLGRRFTGRDAREPGAVNHVSLGSHCHMAQALKETGLRRWSAPFDWIFSLPGMVRDCLADDFAGLLDRAQYERVTVAGLPEPAVRCGHRLYRERHGLPFVFNHHDPAGSEADYRFLADGVRRLRAALDTSGTQNRLYLMASLPTPDETVAEIAGLLAGRKARNRLVFIQIVPGTDASRAVRMASDGPNLDRFRLETHSASLGLRFADRADDATLAGLVRGVAQVP